MFEIYNNKRVLVTGHTGFKGSWLTLWLMRSGAQIVGYALDPKTETDNYCLTGLSGIIKEYIADIRDKEKLSEVLKKEKSEIIFHLAAQPLVIDSYTDPLYTLETNTLGTANVLEVFRLTDSAKILIVITTDKVYENLESVQGYKETDRLGGNDPYSASKVSAEIFSNAYYQSYFINHPDKKVVTVRAGNVIGGGDWSANRIIPDCIKSIENDEEILIRNPSATRPWQFVLEPLGGYLLIVEQLLRGNKDINGAWNFGPKLDNNITVEDIVKLVIESYGKGKYSKQKEGNGLKETNFLALDISKAADKLRWKPCLNINETIKLTTDWYKNYKDVNVFEFCNRQIEDYEKIWKLKNLS